MKIKYILDDLTETLMTFEGLVQKYSWTPTIKHERQYRKIIAALSTDVLNIPNVKEQPFRPEKKEASFLTDLYKINKSDITPKNVYYRLMSKITTDFQKAHMVLRNAGLSLDTRKEEKKQISY